MRGTKTRPVLVGLLVFLLFIYGARYFILDRARLVTLSADPLYSALAGSLQSGPYGSYLPVEGKDYTVGSVKYFDNGQWAVVSVVPVGTSSDPSSVVLQKQGKTYRTVIGPSNSFLGTNMAGLPADLVKYLNGSGL